MVNRRGKISRTLPSTQKNLLASVVILALALGTLLAKPAGSGAINARKCLNLAVTQKLVAQAYDKITAAQRANEWDMEGHAAKSKELPDQANAELKPATEAANENSPAK